MGIITALLSLPYRATQRVLGAMGYDLVVRSRSSQTRFREGLNLKLPPVLLKALQTRLDAKLSERIEQAFADLEVEIERRMGPSP